MPSGESSKSQMRAAILGVALALVFSACTSERSAGRTDAEVATQIFGWSDTCAAVLAEDLAHTIGVTDRPSGEANNESESRDYPDITLTESSCTRYFESSNCTTEAEEGYLPYTWIQVSVVPSVEWRSAEEAYRLNLTDLSNYSIFIDSETEPSAEIGEPWNEGRAYPAALFEGRKRGAVAMALEDDYFVWVTVEISGVECSPTSEEIAGILAEQYLPDVHASIEERLGEL